MPFNFEQWKESTRQKLQGWKGRMDRAGLHSAYYLIAASAFLPIIEAAHTGDWSALAVLGSAVGTNLLANIVQQSKDKSDVEVAKILETEANATPELKVEIDTMLQKLDALQEAGQALSDSDKAWFAETIQRELKRLNSGIKYEAKLIGAGAIAQGAGAKAVGARGIMIGGNVSDSPLLTGDHNRVVKAGQYIEKQVIEAPKSGPATEKKQTVRRAYLERMRRHCQALPLAALGSEDGNGDEVTLDQVYIDLDTAIYIKKSDLEDLRTGKKVRLTESAIAKETPELLERAQEKKDVQPLPLWDAIRATPRVVILGDPGAGKSTFARKLLGMQAAVLLEECGALPGFAPDLLPVLIVLRELALHLDWQKTERLPADEQKKELLAHIRQHLENDLKRTTAEASTALIQQALENGKVLLVLDGLDEVPQTLRKPVRQLVGALLSEYHVERLIITSRIRSYVGSAVFENLQTFTIRPFEKEKIRGFVKAWYNTQAQMGHVAERDLQARIQDLSIAAISDNLREISSNPMMLTSMAIIHQKEIGLPRERVRLYKLVVDVLLRRWQKYKLGEKLLTPSPELAAFLMDEMRLLSAMERLAYETHLAGRQKKESADLPRMKALEILEQKEYLNSLGLAGEFLDYVDQRTGLLKGNGGELEKPTSYGFPHRTFQEYLAGCYLVRDRTPWREIYPRAVEGDAWALAAQLGAEELYYNRRAKHTMLDLAYQLLPAGQATEQEARATLWSAQVARIADLEEIQADQESPRGGQAYLASLPTRLLALFQSELSPLERAEAGRILSALGDPREEVLQIEKLVFCRVPAGEFRMGEGKEEHKVDLPEFFISRFPISNAQFDQFVKAEGYKQKKYWQEAKQEGYWSAAGFKGRFDNEARNAPDDNGAPFNLSNHPVVGVSWYEALAFTRWLTEELKVTGCTLLVYDPTTQAVHIDENLKSEIVNRKSQVCLPSEAEWEKASRGTDGREYPWEGKFNSNFANVAEIGIGTTSALGCFPQGRSPYGLQDMSGNVWEWTRSNADGKDDFQSQDSRVLRGGSFFNGSHYARCAARGWNSPVLRGGDFGFRVVVSPFLPS